MIQFIINNTDYRFIFILNIFNYIILGKNDKENCTEDGMHRMQV